MNCSLTNAFAANISITKGSEKQIAWASDIVANVLKSQDAYLEKVAAQRGREVVYPQSAHSEAAEMVELANKTDAKVIIDSRVLPMCHLLSKLRKIHGV